MRQWIQGWRRVLLPLAMSGLLFAPGSLRSQTSPHGRLSVACEDCHVAASWTVLPDTMKFDHADTKFALIGQHKLVACRRCHATLVFSSAKKQCAECHNDVHRGELGFACQRCHTVDSWLVPDMRQRHAHTRFALVGAHQTAPCQACHVNQQKHEYVGIPTDCFGCHQADYMTTTAPVHQVAGFGTDCQSCHTVTALLWGGTFDHSLTLFPLTGAHVAAPCVQCHSGNRYRGTPAQCMACHANDYNNAANPRHTNFPSDCAGCHSTAAWRPASFNHSTTGFSLTGAHTALPCVQCHANNVYAGTPSACVSCHLADYSATTNPNHASAGFAQTCGTCHSTTSWSGATFNHTWFPTTHGNANGVCATCHTSASDYSVFQCTNCHSQAQTDPRHSAVNGYAYISTACYSCHPSGKTGG